MAKVNTSLTGDIFRLGAEIADAVKKRTGKEFVPHDSRTFENVLLAFGNATDGLLKTDKAALARRTVEWLHTQQPETIPERTVGDKAINKFLIRNNRPLLKPYLSLAK